MEMTEESKQECIQRLLVGKQKAHALEIALRFKGKREEADQVAQRAAELSNQIDELLAQVMTEWLGQAETIIAEIKTANTSLQQATRKIKQDVNTAQNVVRAIGFIDDLVVIATQIAGAFA